MHFLLLGGPIAPVPPHCWGKVSLITLFLRLIVQIEVYLYRLNSKKCKTKPNLSKELYYLIMDKT